MTLCDVESAASRLPQRDGMMVMGRRDVTVRVVGRQNGIVSGRTGLSGLRRFGCVGMVSPVRRQATPP